LTVSDEGGRRREEVVVGVERSKRRDERVEWK